MKNHTQVQFSFFGLIPKFVFIPGPLLKLYPNLFHYRVIKKSISECVSLLGYWEKNAQISLCHWVGFKMPITPASAFVYCHIIHIL